MAKSASAKGFDYRGSLIGVDASPVNLDILIDDSATLTLGDAVRIDADGNLDVVAAGEVILGILQGIVDQSGINVFETGRAGNTDGSTLSGDDTITVSSTNSSASDRKLQGRVALTNSYNSKWYNDSNGTLARTNLFQFFDTVAGGDQIDQASASDANGQFQLIEIDPDGDADASKGIFVVNEHQLGASALDTATTKVAA